MKGGPFFGYKIYSPFVSVIIFCCKVWALNHNSEELANFVFPDNLHISAINVICHLTLSFGEGGGFLCMEMHVKRMEILIWFEHTCINPHPTSCRPRHKPCPALQPAKSLCATPCFMFITAK